MNPKLKSLFPLSPFPLVTLIFAILTLSDAANINAIAAAYSYRATTAVSAGDVVVWDSATPFGVHTTTTDSAHTVAGVAAETVTAGNDCVIRQDGGRVAVNVTGPVTHGQWLVTSTIPGKARGVSALQPGIFGRAITDSGTPAPGQVYASLNLGFLGYGTAPGGASALDDLADVYNVAPVNKHVVIYDGVTDNRYENRLLVEADISDLIHNDIDAFHKSDANEIGALTRETTPGGGTKFLVEEATGGAKRYVDYADLPGATGGEANTGANVGVDGVGVFDGKVGVELQFRNVAPASSKVSVTLNGDDIDVDVVPNQINAADLNNLAAARDVYRHFYGWEGLPVSNLGVIDYQQPVRISEIRSGKRIHLTTAGSTASDTEFDVPIPSWFDGSFPTTANLVIMVYRSDADADGALTLTAYNRAGTADAGVNGVDIEPTSNTTWETKTFKLSGSGYTPGETIRLKFSHTLVDQNDYHLIGPGYIKFD